MKKRNRFVLMAVLMGGALALFSPAVFSADESDDDYITFQRCFQDSDLQAK